MNNPIIVKEYEDGSSVLYSKEKLKEVSIMNLFNFSEQEIFDFVAFNLIKQSKLSAIKEISEDHGGQELIKCKYRSEDGCKCAVGFLIPDNVYSPEFEDNGIPSILSKLKVESFNNNELLAKLQMLHDSIPMGAKPIMWFEELKIFASANDYIRFNFTHLKGYKNEVENN